MANVFDQFDPQQQPDNVFNQFDEPQAQPQVQAQQPPSGVSQAERNAAAMFPGAAPAVFGFRRGVETAREGLRQLIADTGGALSGFLDRPEEQQRFRQQSEAAQGRISELDREVAELGPFAQGGAMAGEVAPSAVLPGGPVAGGVAKRVIGGVAADVAASVADPVREGQSRTGNLQTVAGLSGPLRAVGGFAGKVAERFAGARTGNFADPKVADLVRAADAEEISVFLDDATQAPFAQKLSVAAEVFGSFGTAPGRVRQNDEALAAATRWLQRYAGDADDYAEVVQEGLSNKLRIFQKTAAKQYARVSQTINTNVGSDAYRLKTPKLDAAIDQAIAAETAKGERANDAVLRILNDYKNSARGNFDQMIEFRSDLNKDISALYRGNNPPNHTSTQALGSVQEAIDADMGDFAAANGARELWKNANEFYRNTVAQFKKGKLKALTNPNSAAAFDEQAAWRYLTQNSTNPQRARKMWQSLDAKGRAAVRAGLLTEAVEDATKTGAPFSPAKFASSLDKMEPVYSEFFRGRSGEELQGLINVMRHIERAGQFAENPPTGQRVIQFLLAGGTLLEPTTVAASAGAASGIKGLFQTTASRNLLLAAGRATPGTEAFSTIMERLERTLARSVSEDRNTPPPPQGVPSPAGLPPQPGQ